MGERHIKNGYSSLDVGHHKTIDLVQTLSRERGQARAICRLFSVNYSSYHYRINHKGIVNPERERLKKMAIDIHTDSARTIAGQLTQTGKLLAAIKHAV
jgi:hypothetical protein